MLMSLDTLDPFSNASIWKSDDHSPTNPGAEKLSFSRAYTLSLSPQIIYSRSKLLTQLVSSKVYRHLEFQAVGSWWIYHAEHLSGEPAGSLLAAELKRIPNGREDVTFDRSIDLRAKRKLMKFLNFVVDYNNQSEIWEEYADSPLEEFLSARFQIPERLQTVALALTLSLDLPSKTIVRYSLPRIARHLSSIGVFGPGFGAVIPKWGGSSEIAQVACRAGAVGGAVYILGTGVARKEAVTSSGIEVELTNKEIVRTKFLVQPSKPFPESQTSAASIVSKMIAVISSDLASLFVSVVEGGPTPAVSVVVFPSDSLLVNAEPQPYPVYIMAHSSDTGECPIGQCKFTRSPLTHVLEHCVMI
jgi:Rab proteins geranylgeranyltransferase component A